MTFLEWMTANPGMLSAMFFGGLGFLIMAALLPLRVFGKVSDNDFGMYFFLGGMCLALAAIIAISVAVPDASNIRKGAR